MAIGGGGSRPYTPKKPDPEELDVESLFNEFKNLQRRNKWLKGVRLELSPEITERGESAHFEPDYMDQDPVSGEFFMRPSKIKFFLPSLRGAYEASKGTPRTAVGGSTGGQAIKHTDFTKYVKAVLRHEAGHAWQMEQNRIRDIPQFGEETQIKPPKGRASYIDVPQHGKTFNILNRMLAGSGAEALLPKIGLPPEITRARWQQMGKTSPGTEITLPILRGRG